MLSSFLPLGDNDEKVNKKKDLKGKIKYNEIKKMLCKNQNERFTLQDIKEHPWFNMNFNNSGNNFCMIPGIIVGFK